MRVVTVNSAGGKEHRQKAAHHQVVQLLLGFAQATGRLQRWE
jgi:hypothetical protein